MTKYSEIINTWFFMVYFNFTGTLSSKTKGKMNKQTNKTHLYWISMEAESSNWFSPEVMEQGHIRDILIFITAPASGHMIKELCISSSNQEFTVFQLARFYFLHALLKADSTKITIDYTYIYALSCHLFLLQLFPISLKTKTR